jgi:hypothetical protein
MKHNGVLLTPVLHLVKYTTATIFLGIYGDICSKITDGNQRELPFKLYIIHPTAEVPNLL